MRAPLAVGFVFAATLALPARAAEVQVNPVLVTLSPATRSAVIAVHNTAADPVRFEVQVRAWSQSPSGEMLLSPSDDLVAFPPILALAPGEERNLRVAAATAFGSVEKTYRVFLEELPGSAQARSASQVRVVSRIGIPVFLAPGRPLERATVEGLSLSAGRVAFRIRNDGTAHVRPSSVRVIASDTAGNPAWGRDLDAWYVLAGGERTYEVEVPRSACDAVREVAVAVTLEHEVLRARAAVGSACPP